MELLKMGLLLLVGFLFGGYHFDDQVLISERLSGHHCVKLKNTRVLKVFLFLRDKNQRSYFDGRRLPADLRISSGNRELSFGSRNPYSRSGRYCVIY